jgi:hypothetical protein
VSALPPPTAKPWSNLPAANRPRLTQIQRDQICELWYFPLWFNGQEVSHLVPGVIGWVTLLAGGNYLIGDTVRRDLFTFDEYKAATGHDFATDFFPVSGNMLDLHTRVLAAARQGTLPLTISHTRSDADSAIEVSRVHSLDAHGAVCALARTRPGASVLSVDLT